MNTWPVPKSPIGERLEHADRAKALAHYERVAPRIVAAFGAIPLITLYLPEGFEGPEFRVGRLHAEVPAHLPTVPVTTTSGTYPYLALTPESMLWRVHAYAIGFESWTPSTADPLRVRYAHITVTARGSATRTMQRNAARVVRTLLRAQGIDAFVTLDGPAIVIWIPFADAPLYPEVRNWAHDLAARAAASAPDLFERKRDDPPNRIRISASSNAPGHGVTLPYTLRPVPGLPMNLPITWDELDVLVWDAYDVDNAADRLATGDVLAAEITRIGSQRFSILPRPNAPSRSELAPLRESPAPRSEVITLALQILADGKPRSVEELERDAAARDLWPKNERRKYVYATLKAYIEKCVARNEKPLIVQDGDRRFRLNHPADDLPEPKPETAWQPPTALIDKLAQTATGENPDDFELAVLAAFAALGFSTLHIGGTMNPDGVLDAQLGPLGYRVMLECKSAAKPLVRPDVFEAGKFRDTYAAQLCVMVGPAYSGDKETVDEAMNHGVALWSVEDLTIALTIGANPYELRALFAPGLAAGRMADLSWSRDHGLRKRITIICQALREAGWKAQVAAATFHAPADAPLLTEDAAMLLVDDWLVAHDSHAPCTRQEIRDAIAFLTNPRTGTAVWHDATRTAIVIVG